MADSKNDAGQALVVVAFAMLVILGFLGLGLDFGYLRIMKRQLQKAAHPTTNIPVLNLADPLGYLPASSVGAFSGPTQYGILDAWQIEFAALTFAGSKFNTSGFGNNCSSPANGPPVHGSGGVIVE